MKKSDRNNNLKEVALLFFKMGCVAFGGPAAHIAMMEDEVVDKRKWMTRDYFLDLMGATNLIPGPNSTELTMHCGHQRAGILGLFVAGICFIFPAVIITGILAWAYVTYGQLPEVNPYIYGIKPAVLVIIAMAIFKLSKKALKNIKLGILGGLVLVASFLGVNEITALLVAGLLGGLFFYSTRNNSLKSIALSPLLLFQGFSLKFLGSSVFWTFLKVGAILYGSGYVLFAYLDAELVATGLLSRQELVDAIAIGQLTPGPVLSTATFIGYQLNGTTGAILATLGIFLPSFLFVLLLNPLIKKMRASVFLSAFLDSVNVAAVAIMIAVLFKMGQSTLLGWREVVVLAISALLIFVFKKVNTLLIVPIGAVLGYLLTLI